MTIEVNRGFGLCDRNKTIEASLRPHTGPHCKNNKLYSVTPYLTIYYAPNLPLYTLSLYRGLWSLGLLGCPTLYTAYPIPNWEQSRATPILPLRASDLIGRKSSSHSRPIGHAILLAQIAHTHTGVPKRYVNTTQNTKNEKG
jgi:hypothetical protein